MPGIVNCDIKMDTGVDATVPSVVRRKPLPPSARVLHSKRHSILPGSDTHPTMRRTWFDENGVQMSTETAAKSDLLVNYHIAQENLRPPNSPQVFGDQLFPALPYCGLSKDSEIWMKDGDTVVCIGHNVELRIESAILFRSRFKFLIDRLQGLRDEDSAELSRAAPSRNITPIRFVLELPPPSQPIGLNRQRLSVRNFFAALRNKSIAGDDLVTELTHLQLTAVDLLGAHNHPEKAVKFVRKYMQRLKLDDCRYLRSNAIRTLAYCERIRWEKGWIESFAHCVGMMGYGIEDCDSFNELSQRTQQLLQRSHRKQEHDLHAMENILKNFDLAGGAPSTKSDYVAGSKAGRAFQKFLLDYYGQQYGAWPPTKVITSDGRWLTRTIAQRLQEDFGSLYDLLVNNDVLYGLQPGSTTAQLLSLDEHGRLQPLEAVPCGSNFPLQKIISRWNETCGFDPIPHPWALLPKLRNLVLVDQEHHTTSDSLVPALREVEVDPVGLRNAYMSGTNGDVQLTHFSRAFLKHESTTRLEGVNTHDARLGRWLVVYSMMQLLAHVAVDIQGLWYCHGVPYFLNADLKHCPPWDGAKIPRTIRPANVGDSWCWIYAKGLAESRRRSLAPNKNKYDLSRPKFQVKWDDEGRWELSPAEEGGKTFDKR